MKVIVVVVLVCAAGVFQIRGQDDEIIRIDSALVVLNATITDVDGRPVSGLQKNRFSVFEDGVEQPIEFFSAETTPFAAVILLDTSGSMEERVSMARSSAIRFLAGLRESDVAAIYRFDSKIELVHPFSAQRDMDERVFDLKANGMTAMYDAIVKAAFELSKRAERRRAIIVLSDGEDNHSASSAERALRSAHAVDAVIYTVDMSASDGPKRMQNAGVLRNLAERTGGRFISTPGGAQMRDAFEQIVSELGMQYTLGYQPTNTAQNGKWRTIELRVARKNLIIRTRRGYNAPKPKQLSRP